MFIPLLPLLTLAIGLQESVFNHFSYYNTADLAGWTSLFFAGGSVSQVLLGVVTCVNLRVEGRMLKPLFPSFATNIQMSTRLENTPLSSFFNSASVTASDSGEPGIYGPYANLPYGGLELTHPSSANVPIRGLADRLSTSATSPPFSLSTLFAVTTLPDQDHALSLPRPTPVLLPVVVPSPGGGFLSHPLANSYGELESTAPPTIIVVGTTLVDSSASALPSSFPRLGPKSDAHTVVTQDPAVATSTPTPVFSSVARPTLSPTSGTPGDCHSWVWVLLWTLPVAVHLGIGTGLCLAHPKEAELRSYIKFMMRTRQSVYGEPMAEPEVLSAQGKHYLFLNLN
ncbi:hypothetical protein FRC10_005288 [Ceratobasidium sp. 414]|nr:hypothetical protein FRC10_005288 [Ceratobasidium sp. 414]